MKRFAMVMGVLVLGGTAYAGQKLSYEVVVAKTSAYGAVGSARNSADATQYLQVETDVNFAVAQARDSRGNSAMCVTHDPEMVSIARSVKGDSYVYFSWDSAGNCTDIMATNASYLAPKAP